MPDSRVRDLATQTVTTFRGTIISGVKRGGALIATTLVLGGCGGSVAKGPATYAQLHPAGAPGAVDVWRDSKGRLTFHWHGDSPGEIERYDPKKFALAEFSDGQALGSTTYQLSRSAWRTIDAMYGVSEDDVASALSSGSPSPEPVDYAIAAPQHENSGLYEASTDYGTDIGKMARATGLVLPRLTTLGGYPLMNVSFGPQGLAGLAFGPDPMGDSKIVVDIGAYEPGHPNAAGTVYKQMYESRRWPHRHGPVDYMDNEGQITFPYRSGEWITITPQVTPSRSRLAAIIRAVLGAPTG
jgi:hypothetical protein